MNSATSYLFNSGQIDLAIALAERMPADQRGRELSSMLSVALRQNEGGIVPRVLAVLGRSLTDEERVLYCSARVYQSDRAVLQDALRMAEQVEDEELRAEWKKKIDASFLRLGFFEDVSVLSAEEIVAWVKENLGEYCREEEVARVIAHFPFDFDPIIKQARAEAISAGDINRALRIATATREDLTEDELILIFEALRAKKGPDRFRSGTDAAHKLLGLLPAGKGLPILRWIVSTHTSRGDTDDARSLLSDLPAEERSSFAERILARELNPREGVTFRKVWETEKYLGRSLTHGEVRKRLKFVFVDDSVHLDLISRLPSDEQPHFLEKYIEGKVRSHDLAYAQRAAELIPRELTLEELFSMLRSVQSSLEVWRNQVTPAPDMVARSKQDIVDISRCIASRPLPESALQAVP